jgi:predicted ATPase
MIESLQARNFKCFEDQKIEFKPCTLLTGLNGMGKSTILQALLLLRQSHQQGLLQSTGLALNGEFVQIGNAVDALYEDAIEEAIKFDLVINNGTAAFWKFNYNKEADVLDLTENRVADGFFDSSLFSDEFHYLNAERLGPRVSFEISDFQVRRHRQIGARGQYAVHFLTIFERESIPLTQLSHPLSKSDKLRDQVEAWMNEVSPGIQLKLTPHLGMDVVNLQYSYLLGSQISNDYRSTNVGFGITYSLPIFIALLSSRPGSIILLENPEAHLHPKGQARIGELLAIAANAGIQVIMETHSDHILNGIRLAVCNKRIDPQNVSINYFTRQNNEKDKKNFVINPKIDSNGRLDQWPEGFFDEWDKSLEQLIQSGSK